MKPIERYSKTWWQVIKERWLEGNNEFIEEVERRSGVKLRRGEVTMFVNANDTMVGDVLAPASNEKIPPGEYTVVWCDSFRFMLDGGDYNLYKLQPFLNSSNEYVGFRVVKKIKKCNGMQRHFWWKNYQNGKLYCKECGLLYSHRYEEEVHNEPTNA